MLKVYVLLAILVALVAGLYILAPAAPPSWNTLQLNSKIVEQKCLGSDGKTYYGTYPDNISCKQNAESDQEPGIVSSK